MDKRPVITFEVKFDCRKTNDSVYDFTAPMKEQIYLIKGKDKCAVIDNGMGIGSIKSEIDKLTSLPLIMIDTHGHPDHAGGNIEFDKCYLNFNDLPVYKEMVTKEYRINDIRKMFKDKGKIFEDNLLDYAENIVNMNDKVVFDLGDRKLTGYLVPGHTLGSMVFYDDKDKILFAGDSLTIRDTWLYLDYSTSLKTYLESLYRLKFLNLDVKKVLTGHLPNVDDYSILDRKIHLVEDLVFRKAKGEKVQTFAGVGYRYENYNTSIIYNPDRIE